MYRQYSDWLFHKVDQIGSRKSIACELSFCAFCFLLFNNHYTDCFLEELWNLPDTRFAFLSDLSSLGDTAQYPSCDNSSIGSVVLRDNRLNTATVAYYTGTTTGSRACFACNESSGHALNTTTSERVCLSDGTWSGSPIICGTLQNL